MRLSLPASALLVVLWSFPASAQDPFELGAGVGAGFLSTGQAERYANTLGLSFEAFGAYRVSPWMSLRLRAELGVTRFDRTLDFIRAGLGVGAVTTGLAGTIANWAFSDFPQYFPFKQMIGLMGLFIVGGVGYGIAGVLLVLSPLAAISYMDLTTSAAFDVMTRGDSNLFIETGLGALVHAASSRVTPGLGPSVGLGLRHKNFGVGAHLVVGPDWSRFDGAHAFASSITFRGIL